MSPYLYAVIFLVSSILFIYLGLFLIPQKYIAYAQVPYRTASGDAKTINGVGAGYFGPFTRYRTVDAVIQLTYTATGYLNVKWREFVTFYKKSHSNPPKWYNRIYIYSSSFLNEEDNKLTIFLYCPEWERKEYYQVPEYSPDTMVSEFKKWAKIKTISYEVKFGQPFVSGFEIEPQRAIETEVYYIFFSFLHIPLIPLSCYEAAMGETNRKSHKLRTTSYRVYGEQKMKFIEILCIYLRCLGVLSFLVFLYFLYLCIR